MAKYISQPAGRPAGHYGDVAYTLDIIDPVNMKVKKALDVNGNSCTTDPYGGLYLMFSAYDGDYSGNPPTSITKVSYNADTLKSTQNVPSLLGNIYAQGDNLYYAIMGNDFAHGNTINTIMMFNTRTQTVERANFITDNTEITHPWAISGNPVTDEIFISDVKDGQSNGQVFAFNSSGKKEYVIETGVNPYNIVFVGK